MKIQNKYIIYGDIVVGETAKGDKFRFDLVDYNKVKMHNWFMNRGYAGTNISKGSHANGDHSVTRLQLHQLILGYKKGYITDHINRDRSDNRRINLRHVTYTQNAINKKKLSNNTSGFTGVYWEAGRWRARIWINNKNICLGTYELKEDAIKARTKAEEEYFGEYRAL